MKTWLIFYKNILELSRDIWAVILILLTTPFFVLLYWLITVEGATVYRIAILDHDRGEAVEEIIRELESLHYASGKEMLYLQQVSSVTEGEGLIKKQEALFLVEFPSGFSLSLAHPMAEAPPQIRITGDLSNNAYPVASILFWQALERYFNSIIPVAYPVEIVEIPVGISAQMTEFDLYIPGLLVLAIIMVLYSSAFMTAREIEQKTIIRLQLTDLTSFDLVMGISLAQLLTALVSSALTFLTAGLLGFQSQGSLWVALLICSLTGLACTGLGIIVGCYSKTVSKSFLIASVPFIFLMFFSGSIFPLPKILLFTIAGQHVYLFDLLPPTHAVNAMNKIFIHGASLMDIRYELIATSILSLSCYIVGISLFRIKYFSQGLK